MVPQDHKRARYVRCMYLFDSFSSSSCFVSLIHSCSWSWRTIMQFACIMVRQPVFLLLVLAHHNAVFMHYGSQKESLPMLLIKSLLASSQLAFVCEQLSMYTYDAMQGMHIHNTYTWLALLVLAYHNAFECLMVIIMVPLSESHAHYHYLISSHKKVACLYSRLVHSWSSSLRVHDPVQCYLRAFVWCWPFTQRVSNNHCAASWLLLCLGCKISITVVTCIALLLLLSSTVYNNMLTTSSFLPSSTLSILKVIIIPLHYYSPLHNTTTQHSKQKATTQYSWRWRAIFAEDNWNESMSCGLQGSVRPLSRSILCCTDGDVN